MMIVHPWRFSSVADPYFNFVKLLIQPRSGDTGINDYGASARSVLVNGTATLGGLSPWDGHQGVSLDGASGYLSLADDDAWNLANQNFVIDVVTRFDTADQGLLVGRMNGTTDFQDWKLSYSPTTLSFLANTGGSGWDLNFGTTGLTDAIHQYTVVRSGSAWAMFMDGNRVATATSSASITNTANPLFIGRDISNRYLSQSVGAVRITVGTDRGYTGSTIPNALTTGPFPVN